MRTNLRVNVMPKLDMSLRKNVEILRIQRSSNSMHWDIATSLCDLANVYLLEGKMDEALEMHKQSLEMRRELCGHVNIHPHISTSLNCLGNVHYARGTTATQKICMRRA